MCRARQPVTKTSVKSDVVAVPGEIDLLYLFLCAVECRNRGSTEAVWEFVGSADVLRCGNPNRSSRSPE